MGNSFRIDTKISVIIVAGGSGSRMGAEMPKQFLLLGGRPILMHTIERFYDTIPDAELIVVMSSSEFDRWKSLCEEYKFEISHKIVKGGDSRFNSVKNGLATVSSGSEVVMIHDGVRPFVDNMTIFNTLNSLSETGAVIPAVNLVDSMREEQENGEFKVVNRSRYKLIQTPQVFYKDIVLKSYAVDDNVRFTDDATVVEHSGYKITICEGSSTNIKITSPIDLIIGNVLLKQLP